MSTGLPLTDVVSVIMMEKSKDWCNSVVRLPPEQHADDLRGGMEAYVKNKD